MTAERQYPRWLQAHDVIHVLWRLRLISIWTGQEATGRAAARVRAERGEL